LNDLVGGLRERRGLLTGRLPGLRLAIRYDSARTSRGAEGRHAANRNVSGRCSLEKTHSRPNTLGRKLVAPLLAVLAAGCQSGAQDGCKVAHVTDLQLTYSRGHILTPATLNDAQTNMIIDTGSQGTLVTKAAADRLALPIQFTDRLAVGIGGSRRLYSFYARSFRIGALHGEHLPLDVSAVDFTGFDPPADGLFGSDFLSAYDVDFDLWDHKARLFKVISGCSSPAAVLDEPLYMADLVQGGFPGDSSPYVHVQVGGKTLVAEVDSGASFTMIFRRAARRLGLRTEDLAADPHFKSAGVGPETRDSVRHVMTPITIGEITISNLPVAIVDQNMADGTDMLLGTDFLSHVHVWLSFSSHTMVMQYPPKPSPKVPE
jgi:predicted aspartyl protease